VCGTVCSNAAVSLRGSAVLADLPTLLLGADTLLQIGHGFVAWCLVLYAVYLIWVFSGDEWHARGRPQPDLAYLQGLLDRSRWVGEARCSIQPWFALVCTWQQTVSRHNQEPYGSMLSTLEETGLLLSSCGG
jgi:hypothetical protein